jgi:hypothetical protein
MAVAAHSYARISTAYLLGEPFPQATPKCYRAEVGTDKSPAWKEARFQNPIAATCNSMIFTRLSILHSTGRDKEEHADLKGSLEFDRFSKFTLQYRSH